MRHMPMRRYATAAAVGMIAVAAAGCTGNDEPADPAPSSSPIEAVSVQPGGSGAPGNAPESSAPGTPGPEVPGEPSDAQKLGAQNYLTVRENAESTAYPGTAEWEAALRGTTTPEAADSLIEANRPAPDSSDRQIAAANGYVVRVGMGGCTLNPAYDNTDTEAAIQCDLTDIVTTADGATVTNVDPSWTYYGGQAPVQLQLSLVGDKWLVAGDTGDTAG